MGDDEDLESYWELLRPKPERKVTLLVDDRPVETFPIPRHLLQPLLMQQMVFSPTSMNTTLVPRSPNGSRLVRISNNSEFTLFLKLGRYYGPTSCTLAPYTTWEVSTPEEIQGFWSGNGGSGNAFVVYEGPSLYGPVYGT